MRVLRWLVILITSLLVLLFVFEVVVGVFALTLKMKNNKNRSIILNRERVSYEYQIYQHNPHTNQTVGGFATLSREIEGDFETFETDNGDWTMISKIGLQEFKCTGKCSCEEEEEEDYVMGGGKRSFSTPRLVTSGLISIVAGATTFIALERASEYFKEECQEELKNSCSHTSISSSVEICEKRIMRPEDFYMAEDEDDELFKEEEEEEMDLFGEKVKKKKIVIEHDPWEDCYEFNYWCKGFCKENKLTGEQRRMVELVVENFGFDDMPDFVRRFCTGGGKDQKRKLELPVQFEEKDPGYKFKEINYAKKVFRYQLLNPFCQKMGIFNRELYSKYFDELDDSILDDLCGGDHISIKCKEFDPEKML